MNSKPDMSPLPSGQSVLGIIAGAGRLPLQLAECCRTQGRPFFILAFEEATNLQDFLHMPHAVVRLGAVGEALNQLRQAQVKELVLAGSIKRPSFTSLRPDMTGTKLLARLGAAFFSGDDALLRSVISFLEEEGFHVTGSDTILSGLISSDGVLGAITPDDRSKTDIVYGLRVLRKLGELDIGQAVIIENGYVLGVEAAEGTDALIERCAALRREPHGGVLVKARKPSQDRRVDLPTIGSGTVEKMRAAGFSGIAIEANGSIILDREETIAAANAAGIFLVGVHHDQ